MTTFRSLSGAVLSIEEVVALSREGGKVELEPMPGDETLVRLVAKVNEPADKQSSSFRIKPITPIVSDRPNLTASLVATERYRQRNARMRRCLRIGFRRVEMGDDQLQPIDFVDQLGRHPEGWK